MIRGLSLMLLAIIAGLACAVAVVVATAPERSPGGSAKAAEAQVTIQGALDGARDKLSYDALNVTINGVTADLSAEGTFAVSLPQAAYYRVEATGATIFQTLQTFGNAEIRDTTCQCLVIPPIELVARKPGRIELFFGGDSMAGRRYFHMGLREDPLLDHATLAPDLDKLLVHMKPYIATSDFASVNLESVVARREPDKPAPKKYLFFSPPELPKAFKRAGIDHVSLGNNHTADYRAAGVRTTIDALDDAGVLWSGAGMNQAQAERAARIDVKGTRLALYGLVGWRGDWTPNQTATSTKAGAAWGTNEVIDRVTRRELAAGYVPIMEYHGNMEYMDRPSELSLPRFRRAVDHGSPLVIGHHPHVTHGLELYKGALIAHSLGNFLFDQDHPHTHSTFALKVWMENGKFLRAEAIPMNMLDYRPVPAVGGMRETVLRRLYWLSEEMGTHLKLTGGHAAVWRENTPQDGYDCGSPRAFSLANFAPNCGDRASEYGRNLIPRGDFSNTHMGVAEDRYWRTHNGTATIKKTGDADGYLELAPLAAHKPFYVMSASYVRDVYATRFTLKTRIKVPHDAQIDLSKKDKPPEGARLTPAILGEELGSLKLKGSDRWQDISFDFWLPPAPEPRLPPGPSGAAHPFRPILGITYTGRRLGESDAVQFDDIELIEWPPEDIQDDPGVRWWWTHKRPLRDARLAKR